MQDEFGAEYLEADEQARFGARKAYLEGCFFDPSFGEWFCV